MITPLQSIDDVLHELDHIIDQCIAQNNPIAVFTYVYRRTTAKIKAGMLSGRFSNSAGMEQFDVAFAKRFIDAYYLYTSGEEPTHSWQVCFEATKKRTTHLQHVMLGMNAHINLDLGIVAAQQAPGEKIHQIETDFMVVNDLLEELLDEMQLRLGRASRLLFLLDWVGGRKDESVLNFSIKKARDFAWLTANTLAHLPPDEQQQHIQTVDQAIAALAKQVAKPPGRFLTFCLRFVEYFEVKNIARVITLLKLEE